MKRYIRIYLALLRINFSSFVSYRANMINGLFSSLIWSSFVMLSITLLTAKSSSLFGWSRNELLILSGVYNILYSIFYFIFSVNFEDFYFRIDNSLLDAFLLKPINAQFLMSCRDIGFHNIVRFISGLIFVVILLDYQHVHLTFFSYILFCLFLLVSLGILYSIWFLIMTLMIWFTHLRNLVDLLYSLNTITRYPGSMYYHVSPLLFGIFFPFTLIAVIPTEALIGNLTPFSMILSAIVLLLLLFLSHRFWKFALQSYSSVS